MCSTGGSGAFSCRVDVPTRKLIVSIDTGWANCAYSVLQWQATSSVVGADCDTATQADVSLLRWNADGISDDSIQHSKPRAPADGDNGVEVRTIRRIWDWLSDEFDFDDSFNEEGTVLIERVVGPGIPNAICVRVADTAVSYFQAKWPRCSIVMVAPTSRIAFTKRVTGEKQAQVVLHGVQRYSANKKRSIEAVEAICRRMNASAEGAVQIECPPMKRKRKECVIINICADPGMSEAYVRNNTGKRDDLAETLLQALWFVDSKL